MINGLEMAQTVTRPVTSRNGPVTEIPSAMCEAWNTSSQRWEWEPEVSMWKGGSDMETRGIRHGKERALPVMQWRDLGIVKQNPLKKIRTYPVAVRTIHRARHRASGADSP